jgi:hypothetical protein
LRRAQIAAARQAQQLPLFELVEDRRPPSQRTAAGRYSEPGLFDLRRPCPTRRDPPARFHIRPYARRGASSDKTGQTCSREYRSGVQFHLPPRDPDKAADEG